MKCKKAPHQESEKIIEIDPLSAFHLLVTQKEPDVS
jgi:hypothetical protein